jgi:single-stranded DNA-specific DHH superfamily exonuclease
VKILKKLEKLFQIGIDFIKNIDKKEKVVLIHDNDVDGVASAALMLTAIEKMGKKIDKVISLVFDAKKMGKKLKRFEKIITADVPIDLIEKYLLVLGKKMLIIDHHPGRDLNSEKIVMINPRLENPEIYQPTSYVVYKMFKDLIKEKKWIAILGTVGDMGIDDCKDLVKIKNKKNVWKSKFGKASMLVSASISVFGPEKTLEFLMNSKSLDGIIRNKKIILASREFKREFKRCKNEFRKNLEINDKILISKIKPRYKGVCSALITKISTENPEKIIFIFEDKGKVIRIHGRNSIGKVNIGELFRELKIGGGHEKAGAGTISKNDENELKIKILRKLKDFSGLKSNLKPFFI